MSDPLLLPLRLRPRLDPKPWGGHRLARFGLDLSAEPIGEALATAPEAVVVEGPLAGRPLGEVTAADPHRLIGEQGLAVTAGRAVFPLLIKLIDAQQDLSIQVHPDDATAPSGSLGKHEAYHVLDADPGARIALGLRPEVDWETFETAVRRGERVANLLTWKTAQPGATFLSPARTAHALGAGCLVYEIQQPSDVTFRLDDWGRVDAMGKPRTLHVDAGLAVLDPALRPAAIPPVPLGAGRLLLAACKHFALERIELAGGPGPVLRCPGSPQTLTSLTGTVDVATPTGSVRLAEGETAVVSAIAGSCRPMAGRPAVVLRAWVPDLLRDIVVPARAAGHPDRAAAALSGPLADVAHALGDESVSDRGGSR